MTDTTEGQLFTDSSFLYPVTATMLLFCMLIINDSFSLHNHRENITSGFYFQISAILPLQGLSGERKQKKCQVIRDSQAVECQAQLGQCQGAAEGWTLLQHLPALVSQSVSHTAHPCSPSSRCANKTVFCKFRPC
jgi:hypothetical protein